MSQASAIISNSAIDWNVIAAAAAVFAGTLLTSIAGWFVGKKKLAQHIKPEGSDSPFIAGAVIQDNSTIRDATAANRELRDQLLLVCHALEAMTASTVSSNHLHGELLDELKWFRFYVESRRSLPPG